MGMPNEYEAYLSTACLPCVVIGSILFWYRRHQYPVVDRAPWICLILSLCMCIWYLLSSLSLTILPVDSTACIWSEFVINIYLIPGMLLTFVLRSWAILFKFEITKDLNNGRKQTEDHFTMGIGASHNGNDLPAVAASYLSPSPPAAAATAVALGSTGAPPVSSTTATLDAVAAVLTATPTAMSSDHTNDNTNNVATMTSARTISPSHAWSGSPMEASVGMASSASPIASSPPPAHTNAVVAPISPASHTNHVIPVTTTTTIPVAPAPLSPVMIQYGNAWLSKPSWFTLHHKWMRPKFLARFTLIVFGILSGVFITLSIESDYRTCSQIDDIRQAQQTFSAIAAAIELILLALIWRLLIKHGRDTLGIKLELLAVIITGLTGALILFPIFAFVIQDVVAQHLAIDLVAFVIWAWTIVYPLLLARAHRRHQVALAHTVENVESLADLLAIPEGCKSFMLFTSKEFNSESLSFVLRVSSFKKYHAPFATNTNTNTNGRGNGGNGNGHTSARGRRTSTIDTVAEANPINNTNINGRSSSMMNATRKKSNRTTAMDGMNRGSTNISIYDHGHGNGHGDGHDGTMDDGIHGDKHATLPIVAALRNAFAIHELFLVENAVFEVNVSAGIRQRVHNQLSSITPLVAAAARESAPIRSADADALLLLSIVNLFDEAYDEVLHVMQSNSFQRFRMSSAYKQLIASLRHGTTPHGHGGHGDGNGNGDGRDSPLSHISRHQHQSELSDVIRSVVGHGGGTDGLSVSLPVSTFNTPMGTPALTGAVGMGMSGMGGRHSLMMIRSLAGSPPPPLLQSPHGGVHGDLKAALARSPQESTATGRPRAYTAPMTMTISNTNTNPNTSAIGNSNNTNNNSITNGNDHDIDRNNGTNGTMITTVAGTIYTSINQRHTPPPPSTPPLVAVSSSPSPPIIASPALTDTTSIGASPPPPPRITIINASGATRSGHSPNTPGSHHTPRVSPWTHHHTSTSHDTRAICHTPTSPVPTHLTIHPHPPISPASSSSTTPLAAAPSTVAAATASPPLHASTTGARTPSPTNTNGSIGMNRFRSPVSSSRARVNSNRDITFVHTHSPPE